MLYCNIIFLIVYGPILAHMGPYGPVWDRIGPARAHAPHETISEINTFFEKQSGKSPALNPHALNQHLTAADLFCRNGSVWCRLGTQCPYFTTCPSLKVTIFLSTRKLHISLYPSGMKPLFLASRQ